jgi:hypothetical protein
VGLFFLASEAAAIMGQPDAMSQDISSRAGSHGFGEVNPEPFAAATDWS